MNDSPSIHQDFKKILAPGHGKSELLQELEQIMFEQSSLSQRKQQDFEVDCAFQGQEALEMVEKACEEKRNYVVAFIDMRMSPGWNGVETIERLWQVDPNLQVALCTAYSDHS